MQEKYGYLILYIIVVIYLLIYVWISIRRVVYRPILVLIDHKFNTSKNNHFIIWLLKRKNAESNIAYVSLCFALVGEYFLYKTAPISEMSMRWTMILTALLLLSSFIKQCILKYRVTHGLYGTCYSEAKEIVSFILEWYRENGDSNSKPPKLVFTQEEIDECLQVNGGEEYAG